MNTNINLKEFLNRKVDEYNQPSFIYNDPVTIPHQFSRQQDIEIAGLFAALFSWGNRTTIINKSHALLSLMDNAPFDFCMNTSPAKLNRLLNFKHRTFNPTDILYFVSFLQYHYSNNNSLESAFITGMDDKAITVETGLNGFYNYFFSLEDAPARTRKHIAAPQKNASCKRLNMYLRWMVRKDNAGVDFGIWKKIKPSQLVCPIDVHVARVAKRFKLLKRNTIDWQAALELTEYLRNLDAADPVKYDFALFGLGVIEKF
jgi:uncharacterized protein (TIGR02757 family)